MRSCRIARFSVLMLAISAVPTGAQTRQTPEDSAIAQRQYASLRRPQVVAAPVLMYTPETKIGVGAGAMLSRRRPGGRPTTLSGLLIVTQRSQQILELGTSVYTLGDVSRYTGTFVYRKFPTTFYGIGNDADGVEEAYTPQTSGIGLGVDRRLRGPLRAGIGWDFSTSRIREVEPDGLLDRGVVRGAGGGDITGLRASLFWDTRDNVYSAERGSMHALRVARYGDGLGGDYGFSTAALDLRRYLPLSPGHVLALQVDARVSSEGTPFQMMSGLGGDDLLRGYAAGRFRDRHRLAAQAEYRAMIWRGFGAAAFAGTGMVAQQLAEFGDNRLHHAGGAGLRYRMDPHDRLTVRLDYGVGRGSSGLYLTVNEAF
jgi:outer membrane protein assembly factor BamA